jgi:hypothetical protein
MEKSDSNNQILYTRKINRKARKSNSGSNKKHETDIERIEIIKDN